MGTTNHRTAAGAASAVPPPGENLAPSDLLQRLNLPEEVTTQQAAAILGCCKHTVLQYQEEGILEWRNLAPPSSQRPVFRFTLRSVLELRLGYQSGTARPPQPPKPTKTRRRTAASSPYQPKHLHRKKGEDEPPDHNHR
jgi:hypothetical protein